MTVEGNLAVGGERREQCEEQSSTGMSANE